VQFVNEVEINYLNKFIFDNAVNLILDNIMLSITAIEMDSDNIKLFMWKPTEPHIDKYTDNTGIITYIYHIKDIEILEMNGVFDKKIIESHYDETNLDNTGTYVPNDIVLITNNKK
jgi:hypothetical protein